MATFQTLHTSYGLGKIAASAATGVPINLQQVALGDGNGNFVTPSETQISLVREVYRAAVGEVRQDPASSVQYLVEFVVPAAVGGWTIREFGVFDDANQLVSVGNFPATYKPTAAEGATSDLVLQIMIVVSNAGVINLMIDPSVTLASRAWVLSTVNIASIIPGGTTNQVLRKKSNTNGDTEWASPSTTNVTVTAIEEPAQALASGQQTVNLTLTNTVGLAVYIEGVRIFRGAGADLWDQGANGTQIILGKAYPAGSIFRAVQNAPASAIATPLDASKNLSDVQSAATSRNNLDVYSRAESNQLQPSGNVAYTARSTPPVGWLAANGALISRTVYSTLFAAIGTTYGVGDGTTTFALPDLRGEFVRGLDSGRGVDTGRALGSAQSDALKSHQHSVAAAPYLTHGFIAGGGNAFSTDSQSTTGLTGGTETRPRNIALLAIIKW